MTTTPDGQLVTSEVPTLNPGWGIAPPPEARATAAWGARAIYSLPRSRRRTRGTRVKPEAEIDLLWDRKAAVGDDAKLKKLCDWLDRKGLKLLRQRCMAEYLTTDSDDTITVTDGAFTLVASPRASYGYLYIGAWL